MTGLRIARVIIGSWLGWRLAQKKDWSSLVLVLGLLALSQQQ